MGRYAYQEHIPTQVGLLANCLFHCQTVMHAQRNDMHSSIISLPRQFPACIEGSRWQPRTVPVSVSLRLLYQAAMAYRYCTYADSVAQSDTAWPLALFEVQNSGQQVRGISIACDATLVQAIAAGTAICIHFSLNALRWMARQKPKAAMGSLIVAAVAHVHGVAFEVVRR